jgi:5-methylcytosine-specific restriction endonuclease McrA
MGTSNPRRTNSHRRNKVVARVKREEHECWLCGQKVDKTLPPGQPGSPEVDEVIPVSLGGSPYDRKNCRLAHRLCNQRRGNKPPEQFRKPVTLTTSRPW